jgi:hypothetical protein
MDAAEAAMISFLWLAGRERSERDIIVDRNIRG